MDGIIFTGVMLSNLWGENNTTVKNMLLLRKIKWKRFLRLPFRVIHVKFVPNENNDILNLFIFIMGQKSVIAFLKITKNN